MLKCKKSFKVDLRLAPIERAVRPYAERASERARGSAVFSWVVCSVRRKRRERASGAAFDYDSQSVSRCGGVVVVGGGGGISGC